MLRLPVSSNLMYLLPEHSGRPVMLASARCLWLSSTRKHDLGYLMVVASEKLCHLGLHLVFPNLFLGRTIHPNRSGNPGEIVDKVR